MLKWLIIILLPFTSLSQVDTIDSPSEDYIHLIEFQDGRFSGKGWDSVVKHYQDANLFCLGEIHGTEEVPLFFRHLLSNDKVDHYITELDSLTFSIVERDLDHSDQVLVDFPGSFGMYAYKPERYLLSDLKEEKVAFHGIDEIHPVSIKLLLNELKSNTALSKKSHKKLDHYISVYQEAISEGDVTTINSRKTKKKVKKFLRMVNISELRSTNKQIAFILKNWRYFRMRDRGRKMKLKAIEILEDIQPTPDSKVVFKFGGSHISIPQNSAGIKDVGFAVDSIARVQKLRDYHLLTIIVSGNLAFPAKMGLRKYVPFNMHTDPYSKRLRPLANQFDQEQCLFFDLKGFRQVLANKEAVIDPLFLDLLRSFDGIVMFKEGHPAAISE